MEVNNATELWYETTPTHLGSVTATVSMKADTYATSTPSDHYIQLLCIGYLMLHITEWLVDCLYFISSSSSNNSNVDNCLSVWGPKDGAVLAIISESKIYVEGTSRQLHLLTTRMHHINVITMQARSTDDYSRIIMTRLVHSSQSSFTRIRSWGK